MSSALGGVPPRVRPQWLSAFLDLEPAVHAATTAFWVAVTGTTVSPSRGERDEFASLLPPDGDDHLRVQRLGRGPSRVHLDVHVADPRAAADRAVTLGAREVADHGYVVLESPSGLTFCLVGHVASRPAAPVRWPGGRSAVDQVCLDIGARDHDAEVEFWRALTGFAPSGSDRPEFRRLDGPGPLRLLLQRLDEGPGGYHLDLAADDRSAEVARHVGLGAVVLDVRSRWTVLADPAGLRYCVTDRVPAPASR